VRLARPRVKALEDRWLPSTLTVLNTADSGPGSLRAEVAAAHTNDVIVFSPTLGGPTINLTTGELDITTSLKIQGPGAGRLTISAGNASRIFEVDGATTDLALSGLTITDGDGLGGTNPGFGGAIYNDGGALAVSGCNFSGNGAPGDPPGGGAVYGGAVYNFGTLAVSGCTFSGNAAREGGAIYNNGSNGTQTVTATVSDCTFSGNIALDGGAISNGGTLTVTQSTLSGNFLGPYVGGSGGAIDCGGTLTISQSTLCGNSAPFGTGGAIGDGGTVTINQCTLSGNSAEGGLGGAIGLFAPASLTINQSTLSDNSADAAVFPFNGSLFAGGGGAIAAVDATVTINQCILCGNTAGGGQGGAVFNLDGTLTIHQSSLAGNSATGGEGGAIYNSGDGSGGVGSLIIDQSSVLGNSAGAGGGIYNDGGGVLTLKGSSVVGNTAAVGAGADLYNAGSVTLIDSLVFTIDGTGSLAVQQQ
jgi:hypothetical protein